jgi:signal transduction histidine kinase
VKRLPLWLQDAALPAALALIGLVELLVMRPSGWPFGALVNGLSCLLLVWRRRNALLYATAAGVVLLTAPWFGPQLDEPSTPIAILAVITYSLGRFIADLRGMVGLAVIGLSFFGDYLLVDTRDHNISDVVFVTALMAPPYVVGRVARRLAEAAALLERQQEVVKREAIKAERDRIARELHDVIAHSVSAMVVQTAAAQDIVRSDPVKAEAVLADVAETGRKALVETGRLLHVIRDSDDELGLEPTPGVTNVPELVERFRGSGLVVDLDLDASMRPLPAGVDVSVYRIVQEALTNALKYGSGRTANLKLWSTPTVVSVEASNPSGGGGQVGSGLGLLGMAERVAVLGGSLSHGVDLNGRFVLTATIPLAGGPA